jgi:alkylation response protein AidB-like acyl-CoA dehydrogenase
MGLRGSDTATLHFDGVRLPADALLGPEGEGFKQFMKTLDGGRISIGAMALGLAQGSLEVAARYILENKRLGGTLGDQQSVQFKLADMATQVEAARHLVYSSAHLKDSGKPYAKQSAMAKLYASEVGSYCASQAIRLMGLDGFAVSGRVERHYRDVKLCEIGEGTSEIQRLVISRHVLKEYETIMDSVSPPVAVSLSAHV